VPNIYLLIVKKLHNDNFIFFELAIKKMAEMTRN